MEKMQNAEIFSWVPLLGFDKEQADKGVNALLQRMQFKPQGINLFLFHPDIVHQHTGLEEEVTLPPDVCAYYANPYNEERKRQDWTNRDLKTLVDTLRGEKIEAFLSIMNVDIDNLFHNEWLSTHPEVRSCTRESMGVLNPFKHLADGTLYEDFYAEQLCRVTVDYGFTGVHFADNLCPQWGSLYTGDFSVDLIQQFTDHTGICLPTELMNSADCPESARSRGDWIWANCRKEWIEFIAWRWERFWEKIAARLHAVGKKVFVLGMYCTDPFETYYCFGVDLRRLIASGVDYLMPNMAANGSTIGKKRPWRYYEQAAMMPLTDVFVEGGRKLNMLGVKDTTEEWSVLQHAPGLLERDIYYLSSFCRQTASGMKRCLDGFTICLGDGLYEHEWKWLKDRLEIGFNEMPKRVLRPTLVWSDAAFYNTLPAYIESRRWTLHKFVTELAKQGAHTGAVVRMEDLSADSGDLFVPNFDLLSEEEKKKITSYNNGAVICTAALENGFAPEQYGIQPSIYFEDPHSGYKHCAFAFNLPIEDEASILAVLQEDDGSPTIDPKTVPEILESLNGVLPYQKVSVGFVKALAEVFAETGKGLFTCTHPVIPMEMADGRLRLYIFNDDCLHYANAIVTMNRDIEKVKVISKFPVLPVKFTDTGRFSVASRDYPGGSRTFRVLVSLGSVSIVDVYYNE